MPVKKHYIKLVFASVGQRQTFSGVYDRIASDSYIFDRLKVCKTKTEYIDGSIRSRCELIFDSLDEVQYRNLWILLGKNVTMHSLASESNLMLSLFDYEKETK